MRLISRLLLLAALATPLGGLALAACGSDAVGIDACRKIEELRCQIAPQCSPGFDVDRCTRFYRDACLNGLQNTNTSTDPNTLAQGCVDALNAAAACADGGGNSLCPGLALVPDASCTEVSPSDPTACNLIIHCPEAIAACSFVATPADAGVDTAVEAATDAGDAATE